MNLHSKIDPKHVVSRLAIGLFATTILIFANADQIVAQKVEPLSDSEKKAMQQINLKSVTSTVTFLASDEMGGRGTGTREYSIAAAYVAARFRGAGLEPGGEDKTYFQTTDVASIQVPVSGVSLSGDAVPASFGLLFAGNEDVDFEGTIPVGEVGSKEKYEGPVYLNAGKEYDGQQGFRNLLRDLNRLRRQGATAILLGAKSDSLWAGMAKQNAQRPQMGRSRISIPVMVVEQKVPGENKAKLTIPKRIEKKSKYRNVIGVLKGSDPELSKEAIVISAHLDHLGTRPGIKDPIYNGADDNATGVTGVVSLADAFTALDKAPKRTVIFIAFGGEEMGLRGSRFFADHPLWPLEKIVAMINFEMLGRPESGARNKAWATGWDQSDLGELMAIGAKRTGTLIFQHPQFSGGMLYGASDNWPLVQKGVIAHSFSAGSLHDDYHQPSDEWKKLELDHMTAVIKGLFAGTLPIADGVFTPKKAKK